MEKEAWGRGEGVPESDEDGDEGSLVLACTRYMYMYYTKVGPFSLPTCTTALFTLNRPVSSPLELPSLSLGMLAAATGRTLTAVL